MSRSYSAPASPLRALLWKDFSQVKAALLMLTLGIAAFQIIAVLGWTLIPEQQRANPLIVPLLFCGMTPIVAVMACVGLLIGQERQTGAWAWSSSLPQSWRQALASKACVTLGASLLTVIPLAIAPATLWALGYRLETVDLWEFTLAPGGVLLMMLELAVFLSVALLIFRDSLTGLIVGGIWTTIVQFVLASSGTYYLSRWFVFQPDRSINDLRASTLLFSQLTVLLLCGSGALLWLFRWRWSYGQSAEISWRRPALAPAFNSQHIGLPVSRRSPARSEFRMLLTHSFRSSWAIYLGIVTVAILIHWYDTSLHDEFSGVIVLIASLLIGATTFNGDHTSRRFRFFADRGITPFKLITARLLPVSILFGGLGFYVLVRYYDSPMDQMVVFFVAASLGCTGAFLIGALSSLCFDKVVFSIAVALMTGVGIAVLGFIMAQSYFYVHDVNPSWYFLGVYWITPLSLILGLVSLYRLSRSWLIQGSPRLPRQFAWLMPSLVLIPFALPSLFGFLLLPNVPWRGVDTSIPPKATSSRLLAAAAVSYRPSLIMESIERELKVLKLSNSNVPAWNAVTEANATFTAQWKQPESQQQVTAWLQDLEAALGIDIEDNRDNQQIAIGHNLAAPSYEVRRQFDQQLRLTAILGYLLADHDEPELAQRMWASNKRLQELNLLSEPATVDVAPHVFSFYVFEHMLGQLNSEQRAGLGTASELRAHLLPDRDLVAAQARQALQVEASHFRDELQFPIRDWQSLHIGTISPLTRLLPTLRWRQERSLALELQQSLAAIDSQQLQEMPTLNLLQKIYSQWEELKWVKLRVDSRVDAL